MNDKIIISARLYPVNQDMKKVWYVEYKGIDGKRKKLYGRMPNLKNIEDRLQEAGRLIKQLQDGDIGGLSNKPLSAKIYPKDRSLEKKWFVQYKQADGKIKIIYGELNTFKTVSERLFHAKKIIESLTTLPEDMIYNGNQLIRDLWEIYEMRCEGIRPKTAEAYKTNVVSFVTWYRLNKMPKLDIMQAMKFLRTISDNCTNTTRNNYLTNLRSLFADLRRYYKDRYPENPFEEIRKLREARKTKEWFRPDQVKLLSEAISKEDPLLWLGVKFLYYCFDRPVEMRMCKVSDINFDTKKLRVESNDAKNSSIRFVPIPDCFIQDLQYLKNYQSNYYVFTRSGVPGLKYISRDFLSKRHTAILKRFRFPTGFSFYSWKNTGAVKMLMHDQKNIRYISKCMGHSSLDMTDNYFQSLGVDEMSEQIIFPELQ